MDRKEPHLQHGVPSQQRHAASVALIPAVEVEVEVQLVAVANRPCHQPSVPANWNNSNQTYNLTEWKMVDVNKTMMLDI